MRIQLAPLPRIKPFHPSSLHIFMRPCPTGILYSVLPAPWIWNKILRRSSGDTTVLETAPATPPARKAAKTGCAIVCLSCIIPERGVERRDSCPCNRLFSPSTLATTGEGSFLSTLIAKEFRVHDAFAISREGVNVSICGGWMNFEAVTIYSVDLGNFSLVRHTGMADVAYTETTLPRRDQKLVPLNAISCERVRVKFSACGRWVGAEINSLIFGSRPLEKLARFRLWPQRGGVLKGKTP